MKFIDEMELAGKKVLIRVDYNVPIKDGVIRDDNRIRASVPTITQAQSMGAAVILCSHMGKPKGKRVEGLSLAPAAEKLSGLIGGEVAMAPDCIGPEVEKMAAELSPGKVLMLENLRFHPGEEANDPEFSKQLASLAEAYVDDAFGVAHRAHASVVGVTKYIKNCGGGLLLKKEWEYLGEALADPKRPYLAVSGGAKVSSKLGVLKNLLDKVDEMIIGGAMANTFALAQGHDMAASLVEKDLVDEAKNIMAAAEEKGVKLHLPTDFVVGAGPEAKAEGVYAAGAIPAAMMALDIGPETIAAFQKALSGAKTVMWNGPMGAFENPDFAAGSLEVAKAMADLDAITIAGGGDTDVVVHQAGLAGKFSFISTGGGSFLEFIEGKELPAFKALKECG